MEIKRFILITTVFILGIISIFFVFSIKNHKEFIAPKIGVTIYPLYDVVKEIVGDKYEVVLIVPPGAEPHNYELKIEDVKKLRGIKIVFANGLGIDDWTENLIKNFKDVKIIYLYQSVDLIDQDPHFWLSLENMKKIAKIVEKEMENFDKKNREYYQENLDKVLEKIENLQTEAKQTVFSNKFIITQHNAFNYLAKELNLNVAGYLEGENKELTPADLSQLINKIKILNIKVIFKEPGEENNLLKTIAQEYNLKIYELDSIEGKSGLNYFDAYRKNIETLKFIQNE
ncbi:MAG: adhesion B precursor [Candidatus Parcubacteria bacterium]|nr:MAG: adhesion B precursor [Candidatus Parcubacteria bacterium]